MQLFVGTSGFGYDEWKGTFYPSGLATDDRLGFYASRLPTVEINNTFYRMPKREVLERWAVAVPPGFRFAIKASRRITHKGRLEDEDGGVEYLLGQLRSLGDACGPILFQTPPYLRKGVERLRALVAKLPEGTRATFELRHPSWHDEEVHEVLRQAGHAVCVGDHDTADADDESSAQAATIAAPELTRTAPWGYLRLHAERYDDDALRTWAQRIGQTWDEAYVFFSHERSGPHLAARMIAIARDLGLEAPGA